MSPLVRLLALAAAAAVAAAPSALGSRADTTFTVSSSLDGKKVLPLRSHWLGYTDLPPAQVDRVEFVIDGTIRWVEHTAPYNYGSDHNGKEMGYLITTWLRPGLHVFTVRIHDKAGHARQHAVTARVVAAPAPPPQLAGTWTRPDKGGRTGWEDQLWFDRVGVWYVTVPPHPRRLPAGIVDQFDVRGHTLNLYAAVVHGVQEVENGVCRGNGCLRVRHDGRLYEFNGCVCNFSGPFGSYSWSVSGDTLTLRLVHEGCLGRGQFFAGTWTRTT